MSNTWSAGLSRLFYRTPATLEAFQRSYAQNFEQCRWEPHPSYSVFTQYDQDYYLKKQDEFLHKYRCFYSVSRTIRPRRLIELGTSAGSSADAYLSATPGAHYIGYDSFGATAHRTDGSMWDPHAIAQKLFEARGFKQCELIRCDLRQLPRLKHRADMVVVDAGHDFRNQYGDLKLALTADPRFIFVDDARGTDGVQEAIEQFLAEDIRDSVDYCIPVDYLGGGLVVKLK